jgi:transposase
LESAAKRVPAVSDVSSAYAGVGSSASVLENAQGARGRSSRPRQVRSGGGFHRRNPRGRQKGGSLVGKTRRGSATKIMAIADRNGLPIAIGIASGPRHEAKLVLETLGQRFVRGRLIRLIGDKAYDSNGLDADLRKRGIDMISPNLSTRAEQNQDLRKLRRYRRRWLVERLFAWLMKSRRLVTRYEHRAENFLGLVQLACVVILLRRF